MKWYFRVMISLALLGLTGCRSGENIPASPPEKDLDKAPQQAVVTAKGSTIRLPLKAGKQVWEAEAENITGDFIAGTGVIQGIKCRLLENDQLVISGEAGQASYDKATQQITLSGGAFAQWSEKNAKVSAEQIVWQLDRRQLVAEGKVHFSRGEEQLTAGRLEADFGLKSVALSD